MADAVTTQIIQDGPRNAIMKFTNISDGTGESAVTKVDVSALSTYDGVGVCTGVKINKIHFDNSGMVVRMLWDATTDVIIMTVGDGRYSFDFSSFGGITNDAGTGVTGDIAFTTVGHTAGDSYSIILELIKTYG